jgi:eukaryotic-like serine/threonine-protein kinase
MLRKLFCLLMAVTFIVAGGRSVSFADEPNITLTRADPGRSGQYNVSGLPTYTDIRWNTKLAPSTGSPVVADGKLYVGALKGRLYALDAATGQALWRFSELGGYVTPVAVAGNTVFVGGESKTLFALNSENGEVIWSFKVKGMIWHAPLVVDETVYIGSEGGDFYALSTTTGEVKWQADLKERILPAAAYSNGMVYVSAYSKLVALDAATGEPKWSIKREYWEAPAVVDGVVYVGSMKAFYALKAETGEGLWKFTAEGDAWSAPAINYR